MRLGTFSAAGTTGSDVVVGVVIADAGATEKVKNPHTDARPRPVLIRARRIPPPFSALPALHEVYGATFCLAKGLG
jgi:hypothetical protein